MAGCELQSRQSFVALTTCCHRLTLLSNGFLAWSRLMSQIVMVRIATLGLLFGLWK